MAWKMFPFDSYFYSFPINSSYSSDFLLRISIFEPDQSWAPSIILCNRNGLSVNVVKMYERK